MKNKGNGIPFDFARPDRSAKKPNDDQGSKAHALACRINAEMQARINADDDPLYTKDDYDDSP